MVCSMEVLAFILLGGFISRMCGGGKPKLPLGIDQWLYAIPYGVITYLYSQSILWSVLAYLGAFLGKRTGHGGWMDLGTWTKPREDERLEFIIKALHGKIYEYWYDFIGLCLVGLAVSLMSAVIVGSVSPLAGFILMLSGALKAVAYSIGWKIRRKPTEIGEFLTGIFGYAGIAIAYLII